MKDLTVNYNVEHPYENYFQNQWMCKGLEKVPSNYMIFFMSGISLLPYRVWLIVRDIFVNSIQDLCSDQFNGKKIERLLYNLVSGFVLNPLYLISGFALYVSYGVMFASNSISATHISKSINWLNYKIEAISCYPYAKLADALGLDDNKFYKNN